VNSKRRVHNSLPGGSSLADPSLKCAEGLGRELFAIRCERRLVDVAPAQRHVATADLLKQKLQMEQPKLTRCDLFGTEMHRVTDARLRDEAPHFDAMPPRDALRWRVLKRHARAVPSQNCRTRIESGGYADGECCVLRGRKRKSRITIGREDREFEDVVAEGCRLRPLTREKWHASRILPTSLEEALRLHILHP
jgi:hypothetical protein